MALRKEYLESLGLEIAKKKYYNAARVESVIEDFGRGVAALQREKAALEEEKAALENENAALRARAEALASGREEIGDAILSAKVISQQLISEAREEAEAILAAAKEEAARLGAEAEQTLREKSAACETREKQTLRTVQDAYLRLRDECLGTAKLLDGEWQQFLLSLDGAVPEREAPLPEDLADKLDEIAQSLGEIGAQSEEDGD